MTDNVCSNSNSCAFWLLCIRHHSIIQVSYCAHPLGAITAVSCSITYGIQLLGPSVCCTIITNKSEVAQRSMSRYTR
jgi:hypothetical protein